MNILSVVCHNGLGHLKRTLSVLNEIGNKQSDLDITLVCESWQIKGAKEWGIYDKLLENVNIIMGITEPGVHWNNNVDGYNDNRLLDWENRLSRIDDLEKADIVLSDNLTGILNYREDAVLMGSFLWGDVLTEAYPNDQQVKNFSQQENELLNKHKPHMLCLEKMVMDAVLNSTQAITLPWFFEPLQQEVFQSPRHGVGIIGGGTGSSTQFLNLLAQELSNKKKFQKIFTASNIEAVDFSLLSVPQQLKELKLVICRAGIGTITDCLQNQTPIVAVYEGNNKEMVHNAKKVQQLKLGIAVDSQSEVSDVVEQIQNFMNSKNYSEAMAVMQESAGEGHIKAAQWILEKL